MHCPGCQHKTHLLDRLCGWFSCVKLLFKCLGELWRILILHLAQDLRIYIRMLQTFKRKQSWSKFQGVASLKLILCIISSNGWKSVKEWWEDQPLELSTILPTLCFWYQGCRVLILEGHLILRQPCPTPIISLEGSPSFTIYCEVLACIKKTNEKSNLKKADNFSDRPKQSTISNKRNWSWWLRQSLESLAHFGAFQLTQSIS